MHTIVLPSMISDCANLLHWTWLCFICVYISRSLQPIGHEISLWSADLYDGGCICYLRRSWIYWIIYACWHGLLHLKLRCRGRQYWDDPWLIDYHMKRVCLGGSLYVLFKTIQEVFVVLVVILLVLSICEDRDCCTHPRVTTRVQ